MNDHGLPLAMYPRREICVTLEVATGVGGGFEEWVITGEESEVMRVKGTTAENS